MEVSEERRMIIPRRLVYLTFLLLGLIAVWGARLWGAAQQGIPAPALRRYQEGIAHVAAGRESDAVASFEFAVRAHPTYADAFAEMGLAYMKLRDAPSAVQALRAAAELNPLRPHLYCQLGEAYLRDYDSKSAKAHLDAALSFHPHCAHARFVMGEWYRRKALFSKALEQFEFAARYAPDTEEPLVKIADICLMPSFRRLDKAEWALKRALAIAPQHPLVQFDWGRLWAQRPPTQENLQRAYVALTAAAKGQPHLQAAHSELGRVCEKMGKSDEALQHYNRALTIYPNDKLLRYNLGQLLLRLNKSQEAQKHFGAARQLDEKEKQLQHWQARLDPDGDNLEARLRLAELYEALRLFDEAETQMRLAQHEHPENADVAKRLAALHQRR
jgi:tetratricopeptide (TPR) repeat protein